MSEQLTCHPVIGITGKALHGKDTLAQAIKEENYGDAIIYPFAKPLKGLASKIFGVHSILFNDQQLKAKPILINVNHVDLFNLSQLTDDLNIIPASMYEAIPRRGRSRWDAFFDNVRKALKSELKKWGRRHSYLRSANLVWVTPRQILQILGTNIVRNMIDNDFWVKAYIRNVENMRMKSMVITPDVRFDNEALVIRGEFGGSVIGIHRPDMDEMENGGSNHASEQPIDSDLVSTYVVNDKSIDDLRSKVKKLKTKGML